MSAGAAFALHPEVDPAALREAYARDGRVQIAPFLADDGASRLRDHLAGRDDWRLVLKTEPREFEFDAAARAELGEAKLDSLRKLAAPTPRDLTYAYERIAIRTGEAAWEEEEGTLLAEFAAFLSGAPVLALFRAVTGSDAIAFADAKASRYGPDDYLSLHHDKSEGSRRIAAYVLGLSDGWRAEHGGLLLFHDSAGEVIRGYVPRLNALTLFAVPQAHSVSQVTAFAPGPRLSITGWFMPAGRA